MKKGRIALIVILCLMTVIVIYSIFIRKFDSPIKKQNILTSKHANKPTPSLPKNFDDIKEHVDKNGDALPFEKNTVKIGRKFSQNGMSFIVNSVQVTKKALDTDANYYVDENEPVKFDANGNITNDYTYIVVNLTIKNEKTADNEFYLNMFHYIPISKQKNERIDDCYYGGTLRGYKTKADSYRIDKSYFRKVYKPGEQYTCNLVFIQKDTDYSDYDPYLELNATGGKYNPKGMNIFVKLR